MKVIVIKVDQTIVDKVDGDCTRACIASLLELPLDAVPNFIRFKSNWFFLMKDFLQRLDYDFIGTGYPDTHILKDSLNVKGYIMASVPSKTFEGIRHSVVIDLNGVVVHDPNPNKAWQDINVLESKELHAWSLIAPHTNYTRCSFSINEYDPDGDLSNEGIYLHFGDVKIKVAEDKAGLENFRKHISNLCNEIKENY